MFKKKKDKAAAAAGKKEAAPKGKGLSLSFLDKLLKKKGGGKEAEAPKNACPECGVAFMPWISFCTRCKVHLKG